MPPKKSSTTKKTKSSQSIKYDDTTCEDVIIERQIKPFTIFFDTDENITDIIKQNKDLANNNIDTNILWVEKYRPHTLDEYMIDKKQLDIIDNWISNFIKKMRSNYEISKINRINKVREKYCQSNNGQDIEKNTIEPSKYNKLSNKSSNKSPKSNISSSTSTSSISTTCINEIDNEDDEEIKPFLILHGPPGTGKTTLANLLLDKYNLSKYEINASDARNKSSINELFGRLTPYDATVDKFTGIIMDEVDGMTSGDNGGITELINIATKKQLIKSISINSKTKNNITVSKSIITPRYNYPIICTCNNIKDAKIQNLLKMAMVINIGYPTRENTTKLLNRICDNEKLNNIITKIDIENILNSPISRDYRQIIWSLNSLSIDRKNAANDIVNDTVNNMDDSTIVNIDDSDMSLNGTDAGIRAYKYGDTSLERLYNLSKINIDNSKKITMDDIYISASSDPITFYLHLYYNIPEIMMNIQIAKKVRTRNAMYEDLKRIGDMYESLTFADELQNYGRNGLNGMNRWDLPNYGDYIYSNKIIREIQKYNKGKTSEFRLQHHILYNMTRQDFVRNYKLYVNNFNMTMTIDTIQLYYLIKSKIDSVKKLNNITLHQSNKAFWNNNIKIDEGYQKIITKIDNIFPEDI